MKKVFDSRYATLLLIVICGAYFLVSNNLGKIRIRLNIVSFSSIFKLWIWMSWNEYYDIFFKGVNTIDCFINYLSYAKDIFPRFKLLKIKITINKFWKVSSFINLPLPPPYQGGGLGVVLELKISHCVTSATNY